jgi:hypothetical protein
MDRLCIPPDRLGPHAAASKHWLDSSKPKRRRTLQKTEKSKKTLLLCGLLIVVPATSFAGADESTKKAEANTVTVDSASTPGEIATRSDSSDQQAPRQTKRGEAGLMGVEVRLSTLGAGAEVGVSLSNRLNVRGGFNIFQYSRGFDHDGITYKGQLNLRSGEAHLDWYPLGHTFHLSPGLLVYNGNGATATANVPGGSTFTLGGTTYSSDPTNPIAGTGKLDFVKAAPTAMFGFGNLVPQHRHFTYNFELGAVFQGSARTKLNLTGNACDAFGLNCVHAATDPTVQANVVAEQTKINNKLSPFKYYPVVSFGFGYRF